MMYSYASLSAPAVIWRTSPMVAVYLLCLSTMIEASPYSPPVGHEAHHLAPAGDAVRLGFTEELFGEEAVQPIVLAAIFCRTSSAGVLQLDALGKLGRPRAD